VNVLRCPHCRNCFPACALLVLQVGFPRRNVTWGRPTRPEGWAVLVGGFQQSMPNVEYQVNVLRYAQTAYFVACVVTQWANLIVCKTRLNSVFQQVSEIRASVLLSKGYGASTPSSSR